MHIRQSTRITSLGLGQRTVWAIWLQDTLSGFPCYLNIWLLHAIYIYIYKKQDQALRGISLFKVFSFGRFAISFRQFFYVQVLLCKSWRMLVFLFKCGSTYATLPSFSHSPQRPNSFFSSAAVLDILCVWPPCVRIFPICCLPPLPASHIIQASTECGGRAGHGQQMNEHTSMLQFLSWPGRCPILFWGSNREWRGQSMETTLFAYIFSMLCTAGKA